MSTGKSVELLTFFTIVPLVLTMLCQNLAISVRCVPKQEWISDTAARNTLNGRVMAVGSAALVRSLAVRTYFLPQRSWHMLLIAPSPLHIIASLI